MSISPGLSAQQAVTALPSLLTPLWTKYKSLFQNVRNDTHMSKTYGPHVGEFLEKYIQSEMAESMCEEKWTSLAKKTREKMDEIQAQYQIPVEDIHLAQIQIPSVKGVVNLVFNKQIKYSGFNAEYDILCEMEDGETIILDIKCVSSNCHKYCWQQQAIYAWIYYKMYNTIPTSRLYYVYSQKMVQFKLTEEDMRLIDELIRSAPEKLRERVQKQRQKKIEQKRRARERQKAANTEHTATETK